MTARGGEADPLRMGRIGVPKPFRKVPKPFRKARIGVLWDLEQCQLPAFCGGAEIVEKLKSVFLNWGYKGELEVVVIGDTKFIPPAVVDDLQGAGIIFSHIHSEKGRTKVQLLIKMFGWLIPKNVPANILFISKISDEHCLIMKHFSSISTSEYNLIQKSLVPQTVNFAEYFWDWSDFLDGQSRSRPKACCWGDNESGGINNNYYLDRGGNERDDINNSFYQYKRGRKRVSRKKKKKPRVKASPSHDSRDEKDRDGMAKNCRYKPY